MQIFPAIDLCGGQVVRLYQGDYEQMTVYGADPCAAAKKFIEEGAKYLHVVDLDGAREGAPINFSSIKSIAEQGGLYIEVGGGIRTEERIRQYLDLGVGRCILGTIAVKDFEFTARMAQTYGDKIAVGVDARDGYVAINGWKEISCASGGITRLEELKQLQEMGTCGAILGKSLYTGRLNLNQVIREVGKC